MNNPIAFEIGGFEVRWYGVLIALGVILAFALTYINAKKKNLNFDTIIDGFLIAFPCALIGARAYYVIFEWEHYGKHLNEIFLIRNGGLAIHGGLIGAFIAVYIFTRIKKLNLLEYLDLVAPAIILAQGVGRWGNFMNSEAHGDVVSQEFISKFPKFIQDGMFINGQYYHPTFLYESIWNFVVCAILLVILYKKKEGQNGIVLGSYMALYSVGRFFIEGLRTDSLMFFGLRIAQIISLVLIVIGILLIVKAIKHKKK
ncbi:MAG: prolipoprotein diacylglyceryl transferase [Clostridium sp.]